MIARADSVGFTDIVLDVKPLSGEVLYPSAHAPPLVTLDGFTRPAGFDFVGYAMHRARQHGLRVHLNANIFSEGHKYLGTGPIYTDEPGVADDAPRRATSSGPRPRSSGATPPSPTPPARTSAPTSSPSSASSPPTGRTA
jgi:hypothetical protein